MHTSEDQPNGDTADPWSPIQIQLPYMLGGYGVVRSSQDRSLPFIRQHPASKTSEDTFVKPLRRLLIDVSHQMPIPVKRDLNTGMPELRLDVLGVLVLEISRDA